MTRTTGTETRADSTSVIINTEQGKPIRLRTGNDMKAIAWRWNYAIRNRRRWASRGDASRRQREEVQQLAADFGLEPAALVALADAGLVEVSIPYHREETGWEFRIFPWEYVLAAATRERRKSTGSSFTVIRHLRRGEKPTGVRKDVFLYVESAPTRALAEGYDFSTERELARTSATAAALRFETRINPTLAELREAVRDLCPRIVHVSGFDSHQAASLLAGSNGSEDQGTADDGRTRDGYLMSNGRNGYEVIESLELAKALTAGRAAPDLVAFNLFYSAARTAALCVAHGARASIGFQDTFDDSLAEVFFSTVYQAWHLAGRNAASAFRFGWDQVRAQGRRTTGTGVVLWSADSIADARRRGATQPIMSESDISAAWKGEQRPEPVTAATARDDLRIAVEEIPQLNYSILHNNQPLFKTFTIAKQRHDVGRVDGIDVNVELHVGRDSYPYRLQLSLGETQPTVDIANRIRISLASTLSRAVRECIRTSLFVEVSYQGVSLFRETRRVTLLPVDEWRDSDEHRKWLPSFVLPRDPAVARIIDLSQRYLQALEDDPTAGFDGYQSVEEVDGKRRRLDCEGVDLQVRAIWSALLYETPLSYINPPPTFTDSSQRLRSPSEVIDGKRGTCIDLALLVASCLEYVEIFPTIILLTDHAFPAYWRAEQYYDDFLQARSKSIDPRVLAETSSGSIVPQQTDSWYYMKPHFREVLGEITAGRLVPLEATCLCWRDSFAEACAQGARNLSRRSRFDSMLDVRSARVDEDSPVTPLPMLRVEA